MQLNQLIWSQYSAALAMLENAIRAYPVHLWSKPNEVPVWREDDIVGPWYLAYHTLFFLDYYLTESDVEFAPPPPYTMGEMDPSGVLPDRAYTQEEMLDYLNYGREKARQFVAALTDENATEITRYDPRDLGRLELILYSLRHNQHHAAQLNLLLRLGTGKPAPRWVGKGEG